MRRVLSVLSVLSAGIVVSLSYRAKLLATVVA